MRSVRLPLLLLLLAGCGGAPPAPVVAVASSLAPAFEELAARFGAREGVRVALDVGSSTALRERILAGAPVDLLATARPADLELLRRAGWLGEERPLAATRVALLVPAGNPAGVGGLADLARREELLFGLCAAAAPCGAAAHRLLERAGLPLRPDTEAPHALALVVRLEAGELDAALGYAADARRSPALEEVPLPPELEERIVYHLALAARPSRPEPARRFFRLAAGAEGRAVLGRYGFEEP